jgi:hypothetical protein
MIAVPGAVRLAVAEHLVQCHAEVTGDGLKAHALLLVGLVDLTPNSLPEPTRVTGTARPT